MRSRPALHGARPLVGPFVIALILCAAACSSGAPEPEAPGGVLVRILAVNDFHGALAPGRTVNGTPAGGAAVLAAYLREAARGAEDRTIYAHAGDFVGASPPESSLFRDEPSVAFWGLLGNGDCVPGAPTPRCNVVGALGNHEFDRGRADLLRLLRGGNHPEGPFLGRDWRGPAFPVVCASVVDGTTGEPLLPPHAVVEIAGVRVGFVGALTDETPEIVSPGGIRGLRFLDPVDAANAAVPALRAQGIHALVLLLHDGGRQARYEGPTRPDAPPPSGGIADQVARLDAEFDVVVGGHAHQFTNALLPNRAGRPVLVTQAWAHGTAFADIELRVDVSGGDVLGKSARIVTTWADRGPGRDPDPGVAAFLEPWLEAASAFTSLPVGESHRKIVRAPNDSGESPLGNLVADSQRAAMGADLAFINPGGIRENLPGGRVTMGDLMRIEPFGNALVRMDLTGAQVLEVLEQQWKGQKSPRLLQISGFRYTWDPERPPGRRVVEATRDGLPIHPDRTYSVAVPSFLADGGDRFPAFTRGTNRVGGPRDVEALADYLEGLPQPFAARIEARILRKR